MNKNEIKKILPRRKRSDNKTAGGKCLIVAGSEHMWGAAILAATSASRTGAGYVYIYESQNGFPVCKNPDFLMTKKLNNIKKFSAVALGPGFTDHRFLLNVINQLKREKVKRVVLDAEALNALSEAKKNHKLPTSWIITPHEGELARLMKVTSDKIRLNRKYYVKEAQKKFGCIVVLKGDKTLIATPDKISVNKTGNSALAKAGTGDVLTGIIAGLLSQKLNSDQAALLGCHIHGYLADRWVQNNNDHLSLLASDLVADIPKALRNLRHF